MTSMISYYGFKLQKEVAQPEGSAGDLGEPKYFAYI